MDWKRQILDPLLDESAGSVAPDTPVAILSADADRVQEYVFESARLPEIRGASMLLQNLNEEVATLVEQAVDPACVIYAGGGSLLAIVPDDADLLAKLKRRIESVYPERTGVATTTCITYSTTVGELRSGYGTVMLERINELRGVYPSDWSRVAASYQVYGQDGRPPGEILKEAFEAQRGFGQMVKLAGVMLRRRKEDRPVAPFCEALPHVQRCRSCGIRPAHRIARYFGEVWPLCESCDSKLVGWRDLRSEWTERYEEWLRGDGQELAGGYYVAGYPGALDRPQDVDEIGQACRARQGYVGFVYADGDRVGALLDACRSPAQYKATSDALHDVTKRAVFRALAELTCSTQVKRVEYDRNGDPVLPPVEKIIHPFEIITIGGDDVLLIVPADVALPLAVCICEFFGREIASQLPFKKTATMSAGVVIADAHNPVRVMRDVAKQLLEQSAKVHTHDAHTPSVDFLVLKSQSMLRRDVDDLRSTYPIKLPGEGVRSALRLTGAPYSLDEMKTLLRILRRMRRANFPASQLYLLVEALHDGQERGSLFFLYQQARLCERETGVVLREIEEAWHFDDKTDPVPWNLVRGDRDEAVKYTSILPDLAELYSLIPSWEHIGRWDVLLGGGE
jgi:CRISPR-associated protein Cmr2